jgi:hypothetical protein
MWCCVPQLVEIRDWNNSNEFQLPFAEDRMGNVEARFVTPLT